MLHLEGGLLILLHVLQIIFKNKHSPITEIKPEIDKLFSED